MHLQISTVHIARAEAEMERESRFFRMFYEMVENGEINSVYSLLNDSEYRHRAQKQFRDQVQKRQCEYSPEHRAKTQLLSAEARKDRTILLTYANGKQRIYDAHLMGEKIAYIGLSDDKIWLQPKLENEVLRWDDETYVSRLHLYTASVPLRKEQMRDETKK